MGWPGLTGQQVTPGHNLRKEGTMGCRNCAEIEKHRCSGNGDCHLRVRIAEQIAEPGKIEKWAEVMRFFNLRVEIIGDDFLITAA